MARRVRPISIMRKEEAFFVLDEPIFAPMYELCTTEEAPVFFAVESERDQVTHCAMRVKHVRMNWDFVCSTLQVCLEYERILEIDIKLSIRIREYLMRVFGVVLAASEAVSNARMKSRQTNSIGNGSQMSMASESLFRRPARPACCRKPGRVYGKPTVMTASRDPMSIPSSRAVVAIMPSR